MSDPPRRRDTSEKKTNSSSPANLQRETPVDRAVRGTLMTPRGQEKNPPRRKGRALARTKPIRVCYGFFSAGPGFMLG